MTASETSSFSPPVVVTPPRVAGQRICGRYVRRFVCVCVCLCVCLCAYLCTTSMYVYVNTCVCVPSCEEHHLRKRTRRGGRGEVYHLFTSPPTALHLFMNTQGIESHEPDTSCFRTFSFCSFRVRTSPTSPFESCAYCICQCLVEAQRLRYRDSSVSTYVAKWIPIGKGRTRTVFERWVFNPRRMVR